MCDKLREEKPCIDRYADEKQQDRPIRNFEKRKKLRRYLHQQPRHDCIGNRNFINVAPLEFGKEIKIHFLLLVRPDLLRT